MLGTLHPANLREATEVEKIMWIGARFDYGVRRLWELGDFIESDGFNRQELERGYQRMGYDSQFHREIYLPLNEAWSCFLDVTNMLKTLTPESRKGLREMVTTMATDVKGYYDRLETAYTRDDPTARNFLFINRGDNAQKYSLNAYGRLEGMIEIVSRDS